MKVRFAVSPARGPASTAPLDAFGAEVADMEALGFDTIWLSDVPLMPTIDPLVGLSFAAAATTRLKLGANVVPLGRNPLALAKALAQIDQLSGGRLLLSFVVGIDQPGERAALGAAGLHRGREVEAVMSYLRTWWAGDPVDGDWGPYRFDGLASPGRPVQRPLEIWLGGSGPDALDRVGRCADGWLGSGLTPEEAKAARRRIEAAADEAGRRIDGEHHGMSIPYAAKEPDPATLALLRRRRPDADVAALVPVGPAALRRLIDGYVAAGLSKFVVRSVGPSGGGDLESLAALLLPLQT